MALFFSINASAQSRCLDFFAAITVPKNKTDWKYESLTAFKGKLDPKKLAANGFRLTESGELLDLKSQQPDVPIGKLQTLESKYFFHWSSHEEHAGHLADRGITDEYMKYIIESPGQVAGKGFYISTDPYNSASYGTDVTVFRPAGPVVVLEVTMQNRFRVKEETEFVRRLAAAGVEALRHKGYTQYWYSVISNKHLQKASALPKDILFPYLEKNGYTLETELTLLSRIHVLPVEAVKKLPIDHLLRRAKERGLTGLEIKELVQTVKKSSEKLYENFKNEMILLTFHRFMKASNADEAVTLLQVLRDEFEIYNVHMFLKNALSSEPTTKMKNYLSILELFDTRTVATLAEHKRLAEPIDLKEMRRQALSYRKNLDAVDLSSINNLEDFIAVGEKVFGFRPKLRDRPVLMTGSLKSKEYTFEMTPDVLNQLQSNDVMTVSRVKDSAIRSGTIKGHVEYLSLPKIKVLWPFFSDGLKNQLEVVMNRPGSFDEWAPENRHLLQLALKEATEALLNYEKFKYTPLAGKTRYTAFDYYALFISIHPFKDGNGRMARLYYQMLLQKEPHLGNRDSARLTDLPAYDLDLFIPSEKISELQTMGYVLKQWVAQSENDKAFTLRSKWAMELFFRLYPNWRAQFPELTPIPDL